MQVQKIFLRATESYEDIGYFDLEVKEYDFLMDQIKILNQKTYLSDFEKRKAKGIFAILFYSEKESSIETLDLNETLKMLLGEVYSEFC